MTNLSSRADRQLIEQALSSMESDPRLAEQILQLVKSDDDPTVLSAITEARARQQLWSAAEEAARKWTRSAPESSIAWQALAEIERQQKKIVSSQASLEKALTVTKTTTERDTVHAKLFGLCLLIDDADNARKHIDLIESDQARQVHHESLAYAHLLRLEGNLTEAHQLASKHAAWETDRSAALMLRGIISLDLGQYKAAQADLAAVIAVQPQNKEAHYKLADALRNLNRLDEAKKHFEISQQLGHP